MSLIFKNADQIDGLSAEDSEAVLVSLISALSLYNIWLFGTNLKKKLAGELSPTDKLKQIRTTGIISNISIIATTLSRYYLLNKKRIKPAAVLAGIPLGTVEELSSALSDRVLKYRATGGIFLAHQDGGNESLRIICKAWGIDRYWFLTLLDFIFLYGQSKSLDMFANLEANPFPEAGTILTKQNLKETAQIVNPWTNFKREHTDEGREEYHMTFPIVTKNRIFSSMYLETYDIVESVNNGMNMLTVTLFLRKYRPPYPLQLATVKTLNPKSKKTDTTYWYRSEKIEGESAYTKFKTLKWNDSMLDFGLSLIVMSHKYAMLMGYSIYNWDQMIALSFATHLDKSKGLDEGDIFGISEDKDKTTIVLNEELEKGMGMMM